MAKPNPLPIDQKLVQIDQGLEALKILYEQYFSGLIRREPMDEHEKWKAQLDSITSTELPTAPYKFRHRNIKARYQTYSRLWARTVKQIEEGSFRRENKRIQQKAQVAPAPEPKNLAASLSASTLNVSEKKAVDKLYETLSLKAGAGKKIPEKQKFELQMQSQIQKFKEKNPRSSFQFKLTKDTTGQVQIKIMAKESK
jgi:hypothetical protein